MTVTATRLRGISLVCVPTVEQDKAIEFYESLGFEKRTDEPFSGQYRWVEVYPPEGTTGSDGNVTLTMRQLSGFPAARHQELLVIFLRARKSGDPVTGGISTRLLASFPVSLR